MNTSTTLLYLFLLSLTLVVHPARAVVQKKVLAARCDFEATRHNAGPVTGFITFAENVQGTVDVEYNVQGLFDGVAHTHHVHTWGDLFLDDGTSVSGHFVGNCPGDCRPGAALDEVGLLNNGTAMTMTDGVAAGTYTDHLIKLNGENSIVGRSVVIHGVEGNTGTRAAQCVIGVTAEGSTTVDEASPTVTRAACKLQATSRALDSTLGGYMTFEPVAGSATDVKIRYFVHGLEVGQMHNVHVHMFGDISAADGTNTGGHFIGNACSAGGCRPDGVTQEVGYIGDGHQLNTVVSQTDVTTGDFTDTLVRLNGMDNIIGRSIIIHGGVTSSNRIAQCVIGMTQIGDPADIPNQGGGVPQVTRATAVVRPTMPSPILDPVASGVFPHGLVEFWYKPGQADIIVVRYQFAGLPPGDHPWHVHLKGAGCTGDGLGTGGHFVGSECSSTCRPGAPLQEVGMINDGTPLEADENGVAVGYFEDSVIDFGGVSSIIGRSIVVHGNGTDGNGARVAQGTIARSAEHATNQGTAPNAVTSAVARLTATGNAPQRTARGFVDFWVDSDDVVNVRYEFFDLPPGSHSWHVHVAGDTTSVNSGTATLGHFIGNVPASRGEVGFLNNNTPIVADSSGYAIGTFKDEYLQLEGENSIVGRGIIIHGDGTAEGSGVRILQGPIGMHDETTTSYPPSCPEMMDEAKFIRRTTKAICVFEPTENNALSDLSGQVTFVENDQGTVDVDYSVTGLSVGEHTWHVHTYGNIHSADGTSTGGHFIGDCTNCRPDGEPQEVGLIGNNTNKIVVASPSVAATGSFVDDVIQLNGANSIIGRSIIIHGVSGNSGTRAAQCVIGRDNTLTEEEANGFAVYTDNVDTKVTRAGCRLQATTTKRSVEGDFPAGGYVTFTTKNAYVTTGVDEDEVTVSFYVFGLAEGDHGIHVHHSGDISDGAAAANTQGHFVGDCESCRSESVLQEVGMIGDGTPVRIVDGVATHSFVDSVLQLNGPNSIVGRSVVVHATTGERVLQCVIGVEEEGQKSSYTNAGSTTVGDSPLITQAQALLRPTDQAPALEASRNDRAGGWVTFDLDPLGSGDVTVSYYISGLSNVEYHWAIYEWGNECDTDERSTGAVFGGDCSGGCLPEGRTRAGILARGSFTPVNDVDGVARGSFTDSVISLAQGANNVVGRSLSIIGYSGGIIATGVIGRTVTSDRLFTSDMSQVVYGACSVEPTGNAPDQDLNGFLSFKYDTSTEQMTVEGLVHGLPAGNHGYHVHLHGNLLDRAGATATGGHFVGTLVSPRPDGVLQEVGMVDDGRPMVASASGTAYVRFTDANLKFNGRQSIVGRSIVIHGDGVSSGPRVAQCVIGITGESADESYPTCSRLPSDPASAVCEFQSTTHSAYDVSGSMRVVRLGNDYQVTYEVCGLSEGEHSWHVHDWGNLAYNTGSSAGGHFVGRCDDCRTGSQPDEIGMIGDGMKITAPANDSCASGSFFDPYLRLQGVNSIVGRAMVVHGVSGNTGTRAAHCVIGRGDSWTYGVEVPGYPMVASAIVNFEGTSGSASGAAGGFMKFVDRGTAGVDIEYNLWGLADGTHSFHVHTLGDTSDKVNGLSVSGHYVGDCDNCRPESPVQEVGNIADGKYLIQSLNGIAYGRLTDTVIELNGYNSIVGRSIIVHGDGVSSGKRAAMGVIGMTATTDGAAAEAYSSLDGATSTTGMPLVTRATCVLRATNEATTQIGGVWSFELDPATNDLKSSYHAYQLSVGDHAAHVHVYGDTCGADGKTPLGHYVGDCAATSCRDAGQSTSYNQIGNMNDGAVFITDSHGALSGEFDDEHLHLHGPNSILGRSIVVHGNENGHDARVAQCVIGIAAVDETQYQPVISENVTEAACHFMPTLELRDRDDPTQASTADLRGYMRFRQTSSGDLGVDFHITEIPNGDLRLAVHELGDLSGQGSGMATGDEMMHLADVEGLGCPGRTMGQFVLSNTALTGGNPLIGRSVVLSKNGTRLAQCVIGIRAVDDYEPTECDLLQPLPGHSSTACPVSDSGDDDDDDSTESSTQSQEEFTDTALYITLGFSFGIVAIVAIVAFLVHRNRSNSYNWRKAVEGKPSSSSPSSKSMRQLNTSPNHRDSDQSAVEMDPVDGEGKLPPGWKAFTDDNGNKYFHHAETGESQWHRPVMAQV